MGCDLSLPVSGPALVNNFLTLGCAQLEAAWDMI